MQKKIYQACSLMGRWRSHGASTKPDFYCIWCTKSLLNTTSGFVDISTAGVTIKLKLCSLLPFTFVGHYILPLVYIAKICQPLQNGVPWSISGLYVHSLDVQHVFDPQSGPNYPRLEVAYAFTKIRLPHLWQGAYRVKWDLFRNMLKMLNKCFQKNRCWVRHIGPPCNSIDYSKIFILRFSKSLSLKSRKKADSKMFPQVTNNCHCWILYALMFHP